MTHLKGDPSSLRATNRRAILNHLRRSGPISRTQLAELTGLSPASISGVTAELIEDRLLLEQSIGEAGASGGRRPIFIDINYEAHFAIGLKLSESKLQAVLTDLSLKKLAHITEDLKAHTPNKVATQIGSICKKLYRRAKVNFSDVIGIGIGINGVIDATAGIAVHVPKLAWQNVDVSSLVHDKTGLPVWIDNDVNAFAAAERLFGHAKHAQHFLAIAIGYGLGAAMVCNGELHRGRDGGAGEFGHNMIHPGGRTCSCGRKGCLEAYTIEPALIAAFLERNPKRKKITISKLLELAGAGHEGAQTVLCEAGTLLGLHISYLVNTINPELIVLGGEGTKLGEHYFGPLRETLRAHAFDGLANELPIIVVPWSDADYTLWAQGAASLAVQRAFDTGAAFK